MTRMWILLVLALVLQAAKSEDKKSGKNNCFHFQCVVGENGGELKRSTGALQVIAYCSIAPSTVT